MPKKLKAFRFSPELYELFKKLVVNSRFTITSAFEEFMSLCVQNERLVFPEVANVDAEARVLLAWLKNKQYWYYPSTGDEGQISVTGRLLQLLSKIRDRSLKTEIEETLKKNERV